MACGTQVIGLQRAAASGSRGQCGQALGCRRDASSRSARTSGRVSAWRHCPHAASAMQPRDRRRIGLLGRHRHRPRIRRLRESCAKSGETKKPNTGVTSRNSSRAISVVRCASIEGLHAERGVEASSESTSQPSNANPARLEARTSRRSAFDHMPMLEVAELVCQHRLDLARRQLDQQSVEQDHALGSTEAGEVGVGVGRTAAAVHHEKALAPRSRSAPSSACTRVFNCGRRQAARIY